jgi:hypothetical protein
VHHCVQYAVVFYFESAAAFAAIQAPIGEATFFAQSAQRRHVLT